MQVDVVINIFPQIVLPPRSSNEIINSLISKIPQMKKELF